MSEEPKPAPAEPPKPPAPKPPSVATFRKPYVIPPPKPFFTSPEFRKIVLMAVAALFLIAVQIQCKMNKARLEKEVEEDKKRWAAKEEAAKAPVKSEAPVGAEIRWDNMLADAPDDESLEKVNEERGYKYLIRHLANLKPGEGLGKTEKLDYVDILKNPGQNRGKVVSLSGLSNKTYTNISIGSNQGGFDSVYRLYLVDLSGTEGFIVDVLERPDGVDKRTPVEIEAIFVRTHKYETEKGQKVRVPFYVARRVKVIERGTKEVMWTPKLFVIVGAVAVLVVMVIVIAARAGSKQKPKVS